MTSAISASEAGSGTALTRNPRFVRELELVFRKRAPGFDEGSQLDGGNAFPESRAEGLEQRDAIGGEGPGLVGERAQRTPRTAMHRVFEERAAIRSGACAGAFARPDAAARSRARTLDVTGPAAATENSP